MIWKRLAPTLLIGAGFCLLGAGCAAVSAIVSSPYGDNSSSPERLTAIGRVFENQGHYVQAQTMYRRALKKQPDNLFAKERLASINQRNKSRTFTTDPTAEAVAIADSVETRRSRTNTPALPMSAAAGSHKPAIVNVSATRTVPKTQLPAAPTPPSSSPDVASDTAVLQVVLPAVDAEFTPVTSDVTESVETEASAFAESAFRETAEPLLLDPVEDNVADSEYLPPVEATDEGENKWELQPEPTIELAAVKDEAPADNSPAGATPAALNFAPGRTLESDHTIETVRFDPDAATGSSAWNSTAPAVTLAEIMKWVETPGKFQSELLSALNHGEDEGVQALAASALASCPADDSIDRELRMASSSDSALLRVTALDSLTVRGSLKERDVAGLLSLVSGDNAEIRVQAASSLRNLADSDWADQCVDGLGGLLDDSEPGVVAMAITTLGDFGGAAASHSDLLRELSTAKDGGYVAEVAAHALKRICSANADAQLDSDATPPVTQEISADLFLPETAE